MADITLKAYIAHLDDLLGRRSYEEAEAHAKHILSRFPRNLQALIRLGKAQIEAGHYKDAENTFTQVLGMDPRSTDAYVGLSWVARQRGDGERAIALLERAFEHEPTNQDVIHLLIDANRSFREQHNPKLPQTAYMIARQQWRSGLAHQALATIKSALDAAPGRADLELLRAQIYQSSGSEIDAARSATDVIKKMPDCIEANRLLAEFWKQQGRSSDAQKFISRVESADPFVAYEIASGGPPPDGTFTLPLYDFRAISNKASTAAQPDWLDVIGDASEAEDQVAEPEPTADWLESAEPVLDQDNAGDLGWVADAIEMPDDLNWLDQAAAEPMDFDFEEQSATPAETADSAQPVDSGMAAAPAEQLADGEAGEFDLEWMTPAEDAAQEESAAEDGEFNLDWMTPVEDEAQSEPAADANLDLSWAEAPDESTVDNVPAWSSAQDVTPEVEQWIEDQAADEGDTLPSMTTMKAEQERATTEMAAEPENPPAAEDWLDMSAIDAQADAEPIEDFDEFLKNFTAFGDLDTEEPRPDLSAERTGLTGLLAAAGEQDEQNVAPEVADIDPEDPLAWMRSGTVDHEVYASEGASEDDMPQLEDLLSPTGELEAYSGDVARELDESIEPSAAVTAGATDESDSDPLAWLREHDDIEMVEGEDTPGRRWSDALDVEDGVELDATEADPLAWMQEAGVTVEGDSDDEADPLAWAKEDGLELVDEVVEVTYKPTEALVDPAVPRKTPETTEEPTATSPGMTGLLAFMKADGENVEGDSPMSDHEAPREEPESEPSDVQPEAPQAKEEFDWMATAPADSGSDDIDWDAAPTSEEDEDEAIPDWLAQVSNPVDAAEAAALSAADDPNVSDLWDPGADEVEGEDVPDWMAALRDESPEPEAQAADEAGEWLFSEAEPAAEASEDVEPMPIQPESFEGDAVPDQPAEAGDVVSELADWIGVAGAAAAGAAALSGDSPDEDKSEDNADVAAAAGEADSGEMPDWMATLNEADSRTDSAEDDADSSTDWSPATAQAADESPEWQPSGVTGDTGAQDEATDDDFLNFLNTAGQDAAEVASEAGEQVDESLDWLTSEDDVAADAIGEPADAAGESLDWLNAVDEGDSDRPAAVAADAEPEDGELPDWLTVAGTGAVAESEAADETLDWLDKDDEMADSVPVPPEPDWFSEVDTGRMAAEPADDAPDWLKDVEPAADEAVADSGDLAWLDDSQNVVGVATNIQSELEDAGEPSYELSYIEGEESTEAVETLELEPDNELELGTPVAAMLDADVPSSQLEVQKELSGEILDDADLLEPEPPVDETLTASAANSPDWLNAMVPGLEVNVGAQEDADSDESGEFFNGGKSDFSWLTNIVDEELAPPKVGAPSRRSIRFPFDEPPVWLRVLRDETQTSAPVATADNDDDALPDWLRFDDDAQTN